MRLLFFWKWCSREVSWPFGKPECGRLILETLSLLSHLWAIPRLAPGWASMIRGLKKKEYWSGRGGQKSFSHKPAACLINFLSRLLSPTSPLGPPALVLPLGVRHAGGHLERIWPSRLLGSWSGVGLGYRLVQTTEGSLCRVLSASEQCEMPLCPGLLQPTRGL